MHVKYVGMEMLISEQVQLRCQNSILNLKMLTPNFLANGETGVWPLKIDIQSLTYHFILV